MGLTGRAERAPSNPNYYLNVYNWEWSAENLEQDRTVVGEMLHQEAEQLLGMNLRDLMYQSVHLWRYTDGLVGEPESEP